MGDVFEPPVQYARTSDGVNIAYTAFGNRDGGVPLICLRPPQLSHMALEFQLPFETRWHEFETLAAERLVVRFDSRGCGLSDRGVADVSLEARCRDIAAVADRLRLETFALQGQLHSGTWAIAYAVANPERVSHLILVQAYARGEEYWATPGRAALEPLASIDWNTYTEAAMSNAFAWAPSSLPRALAAQMRASVSPEDFIAFLAEERTCDVTNLLPTVRCPVLVVHFQLNAVTSQDVARRLVSAVPDGRLLLPRDFRESLGAYHEFLSEGPIANQTEDAATAGFQVFLVASAADGGELEQAITRHGGVTIGSPEPSTTASFGSLEAALACGHVLAREYSARVGIGGGEALAAPGEPENQALAVAVRAAGLAEDGEVVVSNVVRELAAGKGFAFAPLRASDASPRLFTLL
jgi:pimeloyl-ACP methyl ester carboxylesterase